MKYSNSLLRRKANGFIQSIQAMNVKDKERLPSSEYADDYNRLWDLVIEANPNLRDLMPPKATRGSPEFGEFVQQPYAEIHTFCSQIYEILGDDAE